MSSTFLGLEIGKRSISFHQNALNVVGHNLANADNDGYSRQRISPVTVTPLTDPSLAREERPGQIGQGVQVSEIRRDRDIYLDQRIIEKTSTESYWKNSEHMLREIEDVHHALGDVNVNSRLDNFWKSWQKLSQFPSEPAGRQDVVQSGISLARGINDHFNSLSTLRRETNEKVIATVDEINTMAGSIANLNTRILQAKAMKDNPNDLLDQRDALVEELATLVDVEMTHKDEDEVMLFVGGKMLVQGQIVSPITLRSNPDKEGMADLYWKTANDSVNPEGGKLKALLDTRDIHIQGQIHRLDSMSRTLVDRVNELHAKGFDINGNKSEDFFTSKFLGTNPSGAFDNNGDGVANVSYVSRISGDQKIKGDSVVGENGTLTFRSAGKNININYSSDMTIAQVVQKINVENSNVNAYINPEGLLILKGTNELIQDPENWNKRQPFAMERIEDSGNFLTGVTGVLAQSGPAGAFDINDPNAANAIRGGNGAIVRTPAGHPSGWITVNNKISSDPQRVAAASGTDFGNGKVISKGERDNSLALAIGDIRKSKLFIDDKQTFDDFYTSMINEVAGKAHAAGMESENYHAVMTSLKDVRQSISGVNIDEEIAKMLAYQHGYQAGARVITVMDQMLDTLINRTGRS